LSEQGSIWTSPKKSRSVEQLKKITLIVRQAEISKVLPDGLQLSLEDEASIVDVIDMADEEIRKQCGEFPVKKCKSLLHMVYHPRENRFYKQVAIQAIHAFRAFLEHKREPKSSFARRSNRNSGSRGRMHN
jgi:hypothetical protein